MNKPVLALAARRALILALTGPTVARQHAYGKIDTGWATMAVKVQRGSATCSTARHVLGDLFARRGTMHGPANDPAYRPRWSVDGWACGYGAGGGCPRSGSRIQAQAVARHLSNHEPREPPPVPRESLPWSRLKVTKTVCSRVMA